MDPQDAMLNYEKAAWSRMDQLFVVVQTCRGCQEPAQQGGCLVPSISHTVGYAGHLVCAVRTCRWYTVHTAQYPGAQTEASLVCVEDLDSFVVDPAP